MGASPSPGLMATGVIHQNAAHLLRRDGEKMHAVLQIMALLVDQFEVSFVNQSGRLQGMIGTLPAQITSGQLAQFVINQRHQLIESLLITTAPLKEQFTHFCAPILSHGAPLIRVKVLLFSSEDTAD